MTILRRVRRPPAVLARGPALALAALAVVPTARAQAPAVPTPAPTPVDVRVMTFNIWLGGDVVDFGKVVDAISAARADIVGLQEAEATRAGSPARSGGRTGAIASTSCRGFR